MLSPPDHPGNSRFRFPSRFFLSAVLAIVAPGFLQAQKVAADKKGNLVFTDATGKLTHLTAEGKDSAPALDPAKRRIVFVRATPGKKVSTGSGEVEATELRIMDVDGKNTAVILRGADDPKVERVLADFQSPQFSPDGKTIYFLGSAWATSGAIHAFDLTTKKVRFVCPGNDLEVVPGGEYAGNLLVQQHRYFLGGGSYDWYWLLHPDGKEIGVVGETTENFREMYFDAQH